MTAVAVFKDGFVPTGPNLCEDPFWKRITLHKAIQEIADLGLNCLTL